MPAEKWQITQQMAISLISGAKRSNEDDTLVKFLGDLGYELNNLSQWCGVHGKGNGGDGKLGDDGGGNTAIAKTYDTVYGGNISY